MRKRRMLLLLVFGLILAPHSGAQEVYDGNQNLPPFGGFSGSKLRHCLFAKRQLTSPCTARLLATARWKNPLVRPHLRHANMVEANHQDD